MSLSPLSGSLGVLGRSRGVAAPSTLLDSLGFYAKLDEASGTRNDSVGTSHLAPTNAPLSAAGKVGDAALFAAASSQYLSVADNATLSTGNIPFTLAAWVYVSSTANQMILGKTSLDGSNGYEYVLYYFNSTARVGFGVGNGTSFQAVQCTNFGALSQNTWYCMIGWHDSVAATLNIQVNNATVTTAARTVTPADTTMPFGIGGTSGNTSRFTGRVDEAALWKRVLTVAERTALYAGGNGVTYPFS